MFVINMGNTTPENNTASVLNQGDEMAERMKCIKLRKTETRFFRTELGRDRACRDATNFGAMPVFPKITHTFNKNTTRYLNGGCTCGYTRQQANCKIYRNTKAKISKTILKNKGHTRPDLDNLSQLCQQYFQGDSKNIKLALTTDHHRHISIILG